MKKLILIYFLVCSLAFAKTLEIKIAKSPAGTENYIKLLLEKSLKQMGHDAKITFTNDEMGFERGFGALASNEINVYWSGNTGQVKGDVYYLNIPITNNLLGTRLFFIPKGTAKDYENIYTLEDLRKSGKVGGFGRGWSDVTIWKNNNLPYLEKENGNWAAIFTMMAKKTRGIDYFSRGVIEILPEKAAIIDKNNLALEVEPNLIFKYNGDFLIYLNKKNGELNKIIESALLNAQKSGLITKTVEEFWKKDFDELNMKNRRVIIVPN